MTSGIAHLTSRALIQVAGPDWRTFLQGLITQEVVDLAEDTLAYGALLTPQGRLLHDLFVSGDGAGGCLDVSAAACDEILAKLTLYRLRAKVQIDRLPDHVVVAAWGSEPPSSNRLWRRDPRLPDLGWRSVQPAGFPASDQSDYNAHRLALGVPDPESDAQDTDYPIELNFDALSGIDFHKGCFVGQETTSRMHRRGMVKTRLAPIRFDGPAPPFGSEILAGDRRVGEVRGGEAGLALALMRIDRARGAVLTVEGRPVEMVLPTWLAPLFSTLADEAPQSDPTLA